MKKLLILLSMMLAMVGAAAHADIIDGAAGVYASDSYSPVADVLHDGDSSPASMFRHAPGVAFSIDHYATGTDGPAGKPIHARTSGVDDHSLHVHSAGARCPVHGLVHRSKVAPGHVLIASRYARPERDQPS